MVDFRLLCQGCGVVQQPGVDGVLFFYLLEQINTEQDTNFPIFRSSSRSSSSIFPCMGSFGIQDWCFRFGFSEFSQRIAHAPRSCGIFPGADLCMEPRSRLLQWPRREYLGEFTPGLVLFDQALQDCEFTRHTSTLCRVDGLMEQPRITASTLVYPQ